MTDTSPLTTLRNWWDKIKPTDGPGHTDYPEVDIKTHRSLARTNRLIGWIALGGGGIAFLKVESINIGLGFLGLGAFMAALMFWSALQFRLEALEWEVELLRGEQEE